MWSSRINLIPFRIFRGPLVLKPVTGRELFFCHFLQQTGSRTEGSWFCDQNSTHIFEEFGFLSPSTFQRFSAIIHFNGKTKKKLGCWILLPSIYATVFSEKFLWPSQKSWTLKFMFSTIATKIDKIFTVDLTLCSKCQIDGEDLVNFCGLLRKHEH